MNQAIVKKPVGRPTKYHDGIISDVATYIDQFEDTNDVLAEGEQTPKKAILPSLVGLANYLKITKETLNQWEKQIDSEGNLLKPEFSDAVKQVRQLCELTLANKGLTGEFKAAPAIFLLKNYCDMTDKTETTQTINKNIRSVHINIEMSQQDAADAYRLLVGNHR